MIELRAEEPVDREAIHRLNIAAFKAEDEARLVDQLRSSCDQYLSFVAVEDDTVVGHILFTPVEVDGSDLIGMGLAPMSVAPARQRAGIGSQLVRHGLEYLRRNACPFVIVLGHPDYYPRFGFRPASNFGLSCQWDGIPDEAFLAIAFDGDRLPISGGTARYRSEFDAAM